MSALIILGIAVVVIIVTGSLIAYFSSTRGEVTYPVGGPYTVVYSQVSGITLTSQSGDSKSGSITFSITSAGSGKNFGISPTTLPYSIGLSTQVSAISGPVTLISNRIIYDSNTNKNVLYAVFNATGTGTAVFTFEIL